MINFFKRTTTGERLMLLKEFLKKVDPKKFNMDTFRSSDDKFEKDYISKTNCGTVGCALGWAPFIAGLEPIEEDFGPESLDWERYSGRIFPDMTGLGSWEWLFDCIWSKFQPTPMDAVWRIEKLLNTARIFSTTKQIGCPLMIKRGFMRNALNKNMRNTKRKNHE